jgi:hypothetical protein
MSTAPIAQTGADFVGLTGGAHVFIALVAGFAILFVLRMVRRRQLSAKYALLWMLAALPLLVLAVFPGLLTWVSEKVGVFYPPALFLLLAVAFLFVIVVQFSYELSRLSERTRTLAEELALLRAERELDGN